MRYWTGLRQRRLPLAATAFLALFVAIELYELHASQEGFTARGVMLELLELAFVVGCTVLIALALASLASEEFSLVRLRQRLWPRRGASRAIVLPTVLVDDGQFDVLECLYHLGGGSRRRAVHSSRLARSLESREIAEPEGRIVELQLLKTIEVTRNWIRLTSVGQYEVERRLFLQPFASLRLH